MKIYIFYLIVLGMISSVDGILCVHIGDGLIQSYVPSSWIDDFKDYIWNNYQLIESEICCIRIPMIYEPTFMQIYFTNRTYCSQTDDGYVKNRKVYSLVVDNICWTLQTLSTTSEYTFLFLFDSWLLWNWFFNETSSLACQWWTSKNFRGTNDSIPYWYNYRLR